ncbi:MAG: hypothetical protein FD156_1621 [Nitrospirae bacterium]|nr:MAG: hypothetical protein FD156_1621 [Nitrospirota bacterium]
MVNPSRFLYRYYSNFEYILDTVINRRIYFLSQEELNDPFDCRLKFSLLHCKKDPEDDWKSYLFYLAKCEYNGISDEETRKHVDAAINKKLHKDNNWLINSDKSIKDSHNECLNSFRICSFSKSPRNQMMWAHYADDHKGMVLQFRSSYFRDDASGDFRGFDIDYYEQPIPLKKYVDAIKNTSEGDKTAYARLIWCSKSDEWSGEDEVRLFSTKKYMSYPEEILTGISIGSECPSHRIDLLLKSISSWKKKPKVFKEAPERSSLIKIYFSLLAK